jgi:hypothetical protein
MKQHFMNLKLFQWNPHPGNLGKTAVEGNHKISQVSNPQIFEAEHFSVKHFTKCCSTPENSYDVQQESLKKWNINRYDRYDLISKPFFICISIIFLYDSKYLIRYEPFFIWCSRKLPSKCFVEFVESDLILENGYVQNGFHILDFRRLNTWVSSW